MKILYTLIATAALALSVHAQQMQVLTSLAANTASNVLSGGFVVDNFNIINATTNAATLKFYDSSTTTTNYVQAAYTSYTTYATNYSTVITNAAGYIYTNTFVGVYTAPTANAGATNTLPLVQVLIVPANSVLNKDVRILVMRGLTVVPDQALTLLTTYRLP
jgi:hypothetical protein